jgi:hypothetical protein
MQPAGLGDRVRRDPFQPGQHDGLHLGWGVRQQHLPDPGGVQRQPRADPAHYGNRGAARDAVEVEHLSPVSYAEVHGCSSGGVDVVQERRSGLTQPRGGRSQQPKIPESLAHDVRPVSLPGKSTPCGELGDEAVRGRQWQVGSSGDVAQPQCLVLGVERGQH